MQMHSSPPTEAVPVQYSQLSDKNRILYNHALSPEENEPASSSPSRSTPPSPTPLGKNKPLASHRPSRLTKAGRPKTAASRSNSSAGVNHHALASVKAKYHPAGSYRAPRRLVYDGVDRSRAPKPPAVGELFTPKGKLHWQVDMARHLAYKGISGPYEIGDYLCHIHIGTGEVMKQAVRTSKAQAQVDDAQKGPVWQNVYTQAIVQEGGFRGDQCGIPMEGLGGSFEGLRTEAVAIRPQTVIPPADKLKPFLHEVEKLKRFALKTDNDPIWFRTSRLD